MYVSMTVKIEVEMTVKCFVGYKLLCILSCCFTVFAQQHGDLRVAGNFSRQNPPFGRLEIFINNVWGTICMHDEFTMESANTACRQLGRAEAVNFNTADAIGFDEGTGPIQLTNVLCGPTDDLIIQCPTGPTVRCSHAQDLVIQCSFDFLKYDGAVRLVNGLYTSSGRLEVFLNSQWGAVCNPRFPLSIAGVVCRQLGYTQANDVSSVSSFRIDSPVWVTSVSCSEDNICFKACYSMDDATVDQRSLCNPTAYVTITCEYIDPIRTSTQVGSSQQCMGQLSDNGNDGGEDNSISTILGLSLGLGIPALIILIFILHKNKAFVKMKASWDDCMSGTRRRLRNCFHPQPQQQNVEVQSHRVTTISSVSDEPTGNDSSRNSATANREYDSKKPPDYNDALTFRKAEIPGEGYPEPSLVDEPPPPSYDSVNN